MVSPTDHTVRLGTGLARYLEAGDPDRTKILLLHGGGLDCASLSWKHLLPRLAATHHVIAPNWPGYGGTTPFRSNYQIRHLGAWLIEFLDELRIKTAVFIGVSMGGGASLWTALNHPRRVEAIVPVGTYGVGKTGPYHFLSYLLTKLPLNVWSYGLMRSNPWMLRQALGSIFADPANVAAEILTEVRDLLDRPDVALAFSRFQRGEMTPSRLRTFLTPYLHSIQQPTLFVQGRHDTLVPLEAVQDAASRMPNAKLELMEAGHWPMREDPDRFNAIIMQFLAEL